MTDIKPQAFQWSGEGMYPLRPKLADQQFVVGEIYMLAPHEDRSVATHNHEFAWLAEAWRTLPEKIADLYPSPEHLRKRALIDCGYYHETITDVGSNAGALRVATRFRALDDFALVIVRGPLVVMRTAKSQSRRSMNKAEFQASKSALMEVVAGLLGISPDTLSHDHGLAAA